MMSDDLIDICVHGIGIKGSHTVSNAMSFKFIAITNLWKNLRDANLCPCQAKNVQSFVPPYMCRNVALKEQYM